MAKKTVATKKQAAAGTARTVRARVTVTPRAEIPDPEGEAIRDALRRLGFDQVTAVRAGRSFEIVLSGVGDDSASDLLHQMCDRLLANAVAEDHAVEILETGGGGG